MHNSYDQPRESRPWEDREGQGERYNDRFFGRERRQGSNRGRVHNYSRGRGRYRHQSRRTTAVHRSQSSYLGEQQQQRQRTSTSEDYQYHHESSRDFVDMGDKHGKGNQKDGSLTEGKPRNIKVASAPALKSDIHQERASSHNSMGRGYTDIDEAAGADGEDIAWEETHEAYNDDIMKPSDLHKNSTDVEKCIGGVARLLRFERTIRLKISTRPLDMCEVPTLPRELTNKVFRFEGFQRGFDEPITAEKKSQFNVLEPVSKVAPTIPINTLAQEFLRNPSKQWWDNSLLQLHTTTPYCHKMLLWARMMLVSEKDRAMLLKADIFRGVLASIYHVPINTSLLAAFLTFWNAEGHTLITSQGELGYPLIAMYDAMGIPISGHLYEEYIPLEHDVSEVVGVLYQAYTAIQASHPEGSSYIVTLQNWVDHFIGEDLAATSHQGIKMPKNFYADPEDPLLSQLNFRTVNIQGRWSAPFGNHMIFQHHPYGREVYRAAFLAAWLCAYCIPVNMGVSIRPEVFPAAASLAQGIRLAIGTASMAHLYQSLDDVCHNISASSKSASECQLPIPAYFIMGWFSSYWKVAPSRPIVDPKLIHFPPFITDAWRITATAIGLNEAHRLFIDLAKDGKFLNSLTFLGRSRIRFPKSTSEILLNDAREPMNGERPTIRITTIDMLISTSVGAVTHTRCQHHRNLAYSPHRFARMHGCDQDVPDFLMEGRNGQFLLQFSSYLKGSQEETVELLQRRHLAYHFPMGHQFHLQPLPRQTKSSIEYVKWCISALNFLKKAEMICSGQQAPSASYQEKTDGKAHSAKEASLVSGSNIDKEITPSSGLGVPTTGVLKKNPSIANIKQEKAAPSSAAQSSNTISPASNAPAVPQSGPTENDFTDGASAKKRSRSKSTAAQFLKASLDINKKVITTASCDPVLANNEASAPEATVALPSDSRKRPSPRRATEEGKEGLLNLEIKEQTLDVATEHKDQHDDNRSKKPRFEHSESDLEQALSKATAMKFNITQTIKCFLDKVGNDFTNLPRHCEPEKTDKYEGRKGILVPQSADCDLGDMASYLRSDLTRIQKLIAAPLLDRAVLSSRIEKCLKCWSAMLQGKIPKELKELMDELEYLKNSLSDKAAHAIPCSVSNLRAYEEHVKERMDIGQKSHQSVMIGYNSLTDYGTVWGDLQDEVKKRKAKYLAEIKELENALRLARSKLRSEQDYEAELKKLSGQYDEIVSETSAAISVFEETLTHGESCLEKINKAIREVERQRGSELPVNLRNQLKFIESCMIEGDENDEE